MRFPFTFLGVMALAFGAWIVIYLLVGRHSLDPTSQGLAIATVVLSWAFGGYVVVRRLRRGPQH